MSQCCAGTAWLERSACHNEQQPPDCSLFLWGQGKSEIEQFRIVCAAISVALQNKLLSIECCLFVSIRRSVSICSFYSKNCSMDNHKIIGWIYVVHVRPHPDPTIENDADLFAFVSNDFEIDISNLLLSFFSFLFEKWINLKFTFREQETKKRYKNISTIHKISIWKLCQTRTKKHEQMHADSVCVLHCGYLWRQTIKCEHTIRSHPFIHSFPMWKLCLFIMRKQAYKIYGVCAQSSSPMLTNYTVLFCWRAIHTQCSWSMEIDRKNGIKIIVVSPSGHVQIQRQLSKCTQKHLDTDTHTRHALPFLLVTISIAIRCHSISNRLLFLFCCVCACMRSDPIWSAFSALNLLGKLNTIFDWTNQTQLASAHPPEKLWRLLSLNIKSDCAQPNNVNNEMYVQCMSQEYSSTFGLSATIFCSSHTSFCLGWLPVQPVLSSHEFNYTKSQIEWFISTKITTLLYNP